MNVVGIGVDLAECARIRSMVDRHGATFLDRVFTTAEQAYCHAHKDPVERLTARWAAKEAVLKALGTGWGKGISWTDVEIVNESSGRPTIRLTGGALEHAGRLGVNTILISLSHTAAHALAYALALGAPS